MKNPVKTRKKPYWLMLKPENSSISWCPQPGQPGQPGLARDNRDSPDSSLSLFRSSERDTELSVITSNQWYTTNRAKSSQLEIKKNKVFKSSNFWHCLFFDSFLPERSTKVTMGCCHASTVSTASELQVRRPGRPDCTMDKLDYDISNFTGFLVMK